MKVSINSFDSEDEQPPLNPQQAQLLQPPLPRFASTTMDFYKDPIPSERKTAISVGFKDVAKPMPTYFREPDNPAISNRLNREVRRLE